jgi:hypothetical protein
MEAPMTRPTTPTADVIGTTPTPAAGKADAEAHHDAVERMLKAITDEVPHPDLWDALHAVDGSRTRSGAPTERVSPRYSGAAKRRSRSTKR